MRPVLLLHVRIVVFLVGASAGELDPFPLAPSLQMPVDEFRTIVRIHSEKTERQGLLHLLQGPFYGRLAAPQHGSGFRPGRMEDRKSTRLNSSHSQISYAVFCLKKKKKKSITEIS